MKRVVLILPPALLIVPLASTGLSCDGSGDSVSSTTTGAPLINDSPAEVQLAKYCDDTIGPACEAYFACCSDPERLAAFGGSVEGCKQQGSANCSGPDEYSIKNRLMPYVEKKLTSLDEAKLAACVAMLKSMAAGGAACTRPPMMVKFFDCITAFRGTLPLGAECDAPVGDLYFIPCNGGFCSSGKCELFTASGAACDPNYLKCNFPNGERCIGLDGMTKCGPADEVGEPCAVGAKASGCLSMSCGPEGACSPPTAGGLCMAP